jgi:hypothetical protein
VQAAGIAKGRARGYRSWGRGDLGADRKSVADATRLFRARATHSCELAAAARDRAFPLAATQTPGWFAAAAHDDYSLLDTAPELLVLPTDLASAAAVDVTGIDLIHVYAPELAEQSEVVAERPAVEPAPVAVKPAHAPVDLPSTSTQLGLLKELSNLDV